MRINKPIIFPIPTLMVEKLDEYLAEKTPSFKYDKTYFYYIIYTILVLQVINKDKDYVSINMNKLASSTVSNINSYVEILKNGEFIFSDYESGKGLKSTGYKLNEKYMAGLSEFSIEPSTKLFDKIIKQQKLKRTHYSRDLKPFEKQLYDKFMQIEFDYSLAKRWAESQPDNVKRMTYLTAIRRLEDKRFRHFKRNKTNHRLDTNLTNLKSDLRQFIKGNFVSIDLKNSQPFFLSVILNHVNTNPDILLCIDKGMSNPSKVFGKRVIDKICKIRLNDENANLANLSKFTDCVVQGNLYEDFIKSYPASITRVEVKEILFKVLFSQNEVHRGYKRFVPYNNEKKIFANVYPFVYENIKQLKEKNHSSLAIHLQKMESYIFIDCIAKELVEDGIVPLTIHDSVVVEAEHADKTLEIMKRVFHENFGVVASFHVKPLKSLENDKLSNLVA